MGKSQEASVESSSFGVQAGFFGAWAHHELRLSKKISLRTELGFDTKIWGGAIYPKTGFLFTPVITLEPRWYYNLAKRERKSRRIDGNSGNFISLKTSYHPDWFVISNHKNIRVIDDLSLVPTWGIKRNIGKRFNFETGIGVGYMRYFIRDNGYVKNRGSAAINVHLRIGYRPGKV